jgi:hypothetical protein
MDSTTYWLTKPTELDQQDIWIVIDLEASYTIGIVNINWGAGYVATNYQVQVSTDDKNWTTVATVSGNTDQQNSIDLASSSAYGRYVRILIDPTADPVGYQYEMEDIAIYGH